jgi:hypothetical protein
MLGLYRQEGEKAWGAVTVSADEGRTWGPVVDIPNGGFKLDAETDIIPLDDGRILAVEREPATSMAFSTSSDGGRTWTVSRPLGFPGHCPYLIRTSGGIIVLAHRLPQTSLHYSFDDGSTWSENVVVDDHIGAYPSMVELKDGSVLVLYYEEGAGSNVRARRFRVGPGGLEWLTFGDSRTYRRDDPPTESGSPQVRVSREGNVWLLKGGQTEVSVDLDSLRLAATTSYGTWTTRPSFDGDLRLGDDSSKDLGSFRLASAARRRAVPYRTGFRTGVKISLSGSTSSSVSMASTRTLSAGSRPRTVTSGSASSSGRLRSSPAPSDQPSFRSCRACSCRGTGRGPSASTTP